MISSVLSAQFMYCVPIAFANDCVRYGSRGFALVTSHHRDKSLAEKGQPVLLDLYMHAANVSRCFNSSQSFCNRQSQMTTGDVLILWTVYSEVIHPHLICLLCMITLTCRGRITSCQFRKPRQAGSYQGHDKNLFEGKGSNCKVIIDAILGKACTKTVILA